MRGGGRVCPGFAIVHTYRYLADRMCKVRKEYLLAVNGLMWTAIGTKISITGVRHYLTAQPGKLWWMIPLSVLVFVGFYRMFTGIVRKYAERIHALPGDKEPIWKTFSLKGYLIIAFMISLGISLKYIPGISEPFFAWFYLGLGPGLLSAGVRFLIRWWKAVNIDKKSVS